MKRRPLVIVAVVGLLIGLLAGSAYGYFTITNTGTGVAGSAALQSVTLAATAGSPKSFLRPGGTADAVLSITNPNPGPVTLIRVIRDGTIIPDDNHSACVTTGVVTFTNQKGLNDVIPGGGATTEVELSGAVSMSASASNACQGARFDIPVTGTVQKG